MSKDRLELSAGDVMRLRGLGVADEDADLSQRLSADCARMAVRNRQLQNLCTQHEQRYLECHRSAQAALNLVDELKQQREVLSFRLGITGTLLAASTAAWLIPLLMHLAAALGVSR
jgi:hypothetical protein